MAKAPVSTASNFYITKFYQLMQRRGLDADAILLNAGLEAAVVDNPGQRIDADALAYVIQQLWRELQDESMSLSPSVIPPGSFYLMGKIAIHEPNLGKALQMAAWFMGMATDAYRVELDIQQSSARLRITLQDPAFDPDRLLAGMLLMAYHRFASWLIAENITLNEVAFNFSPPEEVREYSYLFPGKHLFEASWLGFTFPRRFLDCETRQDAGALKLFMRRCPREFFQRPRTDFSLSSEIQLLLGKRFNEGFPSIEVAAELMHMTKRTLIRKLKEEGTSYQQIKDRVRRDRAIRLLTLNALSISQIAEKLGFSDSAVFARAFKGWTGASPSEYRRSR